MTPQNILNLENIRPWLERNGFASRDWGLLGAALERPRMTFDGTDLYPSIWLKNAALIDSIESSRPLIDGNKRLGALLAIMLLRLHGIDDRPSNDDFWFELISDVAAHHPAIESIASRLETELVGFGNATVVVNLL
ncbi:Fic family protein [Corynebacterium hindlerae]|uniref:type II toxin-antitoxin system death-on-curing family toxin n=1 Tax=Corynebacterium hindlerae TaxID=699041 RepID=UPI001AD60A2F|nr:Fic family protein [Corynebacterium hindlerae]QTH60371.1 Fic family protein [Corynebacterium hindlerae]